MNPVDASQIGLRRPSPTVASAALERRLRRQPRLGCELLQFVAAPLLDGVARGWFMSFLVEIVAMCKNPRTKRIGSIRSFNRAFPVTEHEQGQSEFGRGKITFPDFLKLPTSHNPRWN
jgi:hypothetical protein